MCSAVITAGFIAFVPSTDVTAEAETVQKSISTVNITTEDLVDPPWTFLPPPSGMWGNSITDNSYVNCTVEYVDPLFGPRSAQFYSNNVPGTFCMLKPDGTGWWDDISFPLVER